MKPVADDIISQSVSYLASLQQPSGEFLSFSSFSKNNFVPKYTYHTTFNTAFILLALRNVALDNQVKKLKQKAAHFLLQQKSSFWSWNYWTRNSQEAKTLPYPDDLDDTFCALTALFHYKPSLINGEVLAHVVQLLTANETKPGGPYRTWLVDNKTASTIWHDVDVAVNCNIAYFLFLQEIQTSQLAAFFESALTNHSFSSPYYPSPILLLYFLSRFYQGKQKNTVINHLLKYKQRNGSFGNPLLTALSLTALLHLGFSSFKLKKSYQYLISMQKNGVYKAYAFCADPSRNDKKFVAGSSALTTAFCVEAMVTYQKKVLNEKLTQQQSIQKKKEEKIEKEIIAQVTKRLHSFSPFFRKKAHQFITQFLKTPVSKQVLLLPYFFSLSLGSKQKKISQALLIQLGLANLWGWIAYTIFDDFWDNEGQLELLGLANLASREFTHIFENIVPTSGFFSYYKKIIDQLDEANTWEIMHCRNSEKLPSYRNYDQLAKKSFGHILGPMAILFALGYKETSGEYKSTYSFFKHYLIARQLNDDVHDWEKDLAKGHNNPVTVLILQKHPRLKTKQKDFFSRTVLPEIATLILKHIRLAKNALKHNLLIINTEPLESLLTPLENGAQKAINEQKQLLQFISTYGK